MQERVPSGYPRKENSDTQRLPSARQRTRRHARRENWNIGHIGDWNCSIQLKKTSYFLNLEKEKNAELGAKLEKAKVANKHQIPCVISGRSLVDENKNLNCEKKDEKIEKLTAQLDDANKKNENRAESERGLREQLYRERNLTVQLIQRFNGNDPNKANKSYEEEIQYLLRKFNSENMDDMEQALRTKKQLVKQLGEEKKKLEQKIVDCEKIKDQLNKNISVSSRSTHDLNGCMLELKTLNKDLQQCQIDYKAEKKTNAKKLADSQEEVKKMKKLLDAEKDNCLMEKNSIKKNCEEARVVAKSETIQQVTKCEEEMKTVQSNFRRNVTGLTNDLEGERETCKRKLNEQNAITQQCAEEMKTVQSNFRRNVTELTNDLEGERETCKRKLNEQNAITQQCAEEMKTVQSNFRRNVTELTNDLNALMQKSAEQQKILDENNAACRKQKDEMGKQLESDRSSCLKKINEMNTESENARQEAKIKTDKTIAELFINLNDEMNKFRNDFSGNITSFIANVLKSEREKFKQKIYEIENQMFLRRK